MAYPPSEGDRFQIEQQRHREMIGAINAHTEALKVLADVLRDLKEQIKVSV